MVKLSRRSFLKKSALAGTGLTALNTTSCSHDPRDMDPAIFHEKESARKNLQALIKKKKPAAVKKPNIIVILTDDMGYGDLGCYGNSSISTPTIDRMSHEGVKFTDAYCSNPLCSPSRVGLLTGRYPLRAGICFPMQAGKDTFLRNLIRDLGYLFGSLGIVDLNRAENLATGLPHSEITIPEALKLAGYRNGVVGKWHLGDFVVDKTFHPFNYGFDFFAGFNVSNDDWPIAYWKNQKQLVEDVALDQEKYTRLFTEEALGFMEQSKDTPFFLYLAHKDPHQPCLPSKKFQGTSKAGPHGDTVQEVDWSVKQVLKKLTELKLEKDTLVLFTSDNGPWFDGSAGNLRGSKGESFEGGYRVPMIAWWPGNIPAGKTIREPVMNIDIFPTIMELAGLSLPSDREIDGKSVWKLITGIETQSPHDELYFFHYRDIEGIRSGRWKYFETINTKKWPIPLDKRDTFIGSAAGGRDYSPPGSEKSVPTMGSWPLLYDMKHDPGENYNVIKHHPRVAQKLGKKLQKFQEAFYKNPRGWKS